MKKIASPQELQAEIRGIMDLVHASEKPDREVIASKLRELADRTAAKSEFKKGQKATYKGKAVTVVEVAGSGKVTIKSEGGATKTLSSDEAEKNLK